MVSAFLGFSKAAAFSKWPSVDGAKMFFGRIAKKKKRMRKNARKDRAARPTAPDSA